jgi:hypothetical protein
MIIGVCGFAGSGKDTFADHLVAHHEFQKHGFAYPLKAMAQIAFGFSSAQLFGSQEIKEAEDTRYLFSGVCPSCHRPCSRCTKELQTDVDWFCEPCDAFFKKYVTPRLALQTLGTEWGRTLYPNIWVDAALRDLRGPERRHENWVLCDVRFRNEIEGIQDIGGLVVRLLRGEPRFNHPSETELAQINLETFDCIVDNNGTLAEFYMKIDETVPKLRYLANAL